MKRKIFITGVSGVGKSTLGIELQKRGCSVIDIDEDDLCAWCDMAGNRVIDDARSGDNWLDEHSWRCNMPKLEETIKSSQEDTVFVVGMSSDLDDYSFDQIFLLTLNPNILIQRLTERTTNDFAKDPDEQKYVLGMKDAYEKLMLAKGAVVLDSSKPVSVLADEILNRSATENKV